MRMEAKKKDPSSLPSARHVSSRVAISRALAGFADFSIPEGRFTRCDFVACDKVTTGPRHELFRVNQTYNSLTTVVYVTKNVVGF